MLLNEIKNSKKHMTCRSKENESENDKEIEYLNEVVKKNNKLYLDKLEGSGTFLHCKHQFMQTRLDEPKRKKNS